MIKGGNGTNHVEAESEPFDFVIAIVIMVVGWMGIMFVHLILPYEDNQHSGADLFDPKNGGSLTNDRPFWFITFSSMIVFSIIFILINNISYTKNISGIENGSKGKNALADLLFAFSLFKKRFNVFFSEIFFMITFVMFIWLNYRFYDSFKYRTNISIIKYTIYAFIAFTGLNVGIFCVSYFIPFYNGLSPFKSYIEFLKIMSLSLRGNQVQDYNVKTNLKYLSTVLFIGSMTCLIILYIYVNFYITGE